MPGVPTTSFTANRLTTLSARGFTLVEVMVTIAVIAMLAVTVSFVVPDRRDDTVAEQARILYERINYAREYALVRNAVVGLRIENDPSYRFVQFQEGQWRNIDHRGLRHTELDADLSLSLEAADLALLAQDGTDINRVFRVREDDQEDTQPTPQLLIFGSGDLPPFELIVRDNALLRAGSSWVIYSEDGVDVLLERGPN